MDVAGISDRRDRDIHQCARHPAKGAVSGRLRHVACGCGDGDCRDTHVRYRTRHPDDEFTSRPPVGQARDPTRERTRGTVLFRIAGWRLPASASRAVAAPERERGPAAVLAALPSERKRGLGDVSAGIDRLQAESARLDVRMTQLELTLQEARSGVTPGTESTGEATRSAFAAEADAALRTARSRSVAIASGLEAVRMQLLRLKAGLGTAEDVQRALRDVLGRA